MLTVYCSQCVSSQLSKTAYESACFTPKKEK